MLTIEKMRELVGPKSSEYTDAQLMEVSRDLYQLAYLAFEYYKRHINPTLMWYWLVKMRIYANILNGHN